MLCPHTFFGATDPSGLYNEAGHFFTVFIVAKLAGKNDADAFRLAYYAQLPDQAEFMEAIWSARHADEDMGKKVFDCIHSLHGGDAEASRTRRKQLRDYLKSNFSRLNVWQKGIILHALGDAYAHTNKYDVAWAWKRGHLYAGHKPDWVSTDPKKFKEYVRALYFALGGEGEIEDNAKLMEFLQFSRTVPQNEEGERTQMLLWARDKMGYTGYQDYPYVPNWKYNRIESLAVPKKSDVEKFMNHMCDNVITPGKQTPR